MISYFSSSSTPTDGGTNTANPTAVTPPASMLDGDLVVLVAQNRETSAIVAISEAGGQSWNGLDAFDHSGAQLINGRIFWCRFNGTWSANPSVSFTTSTPVNSIVMHVFRPTDSENLWGVDNAQAIADIGSETTVTINGITTTRASTVALATWMVQDDNTWGSLNGTGWVVTGLAQYRNLSGSDQSSSFAHFIQTSPGSTGNVSKNKSENDTGVTIILSFFEFAASSPRSQIIN